ncbi:TlpA family protein disulfide reductase [Psychroserpens sp.]
MIRISILILILTLFISCNSKQKSTDEIFKKFETTRLSFNSFEYSLNHKKKFLNADDTLNNFSNCRIVRVKNDTLFGSSFWIKYDSIDQYYDLKHVYDINHNKKKIVRFFPHKGEDWIVNSNFINGFLEPYFLKPQQLSEALNDSTIITFSRDTFVNSNKLKVISFSYPDNAQFEKMKKMVFINRSYDIKKITFSVKFQNDWQYDELNFSNESYNKIDNTLLQSEFEKLLLTYTLEDFKKIDPIELYPLKNGLIAPDFKGLNFSTQDSIELKTYRNKVVVIDFWYKGCLPCIQAMPFLNELRVKYSKEKLEILGLNPFDYKNGNIDKLSNFIEYNKLIYPTIFVSQNVQRDYNVSAFPTFYIIDKRGKIVFSKVGYGEENIKTIDSLLNVLVN